MIVKNFFLVAVLCSNLLLLPGINFNQDFIRLLANFVGLLGTILIFWQYLLSSRFIIKLLGGDLWFYNNLHKNLGKYGLILIAFHPLLIFIFYYSFGINLVTDSVSNSFDSAKLLGIIAFSILFIIWLTSAIFRNKLTYRVWKNIHVITYIILPLVLLHSFNISIKDTDLYLTLYWGILFGIYLLVTLSRIFVWSGIFLVQYKIIKKETVTSDVVKVDLLPLNKALNVFPGQFVYFQSKLFGEAHPYTISHINDNGSISITSKSLGKFSAELVNARVNDITYLYGPFGNFTVNAKNEFKNSDLVLVAGGIGITPFIELVKSASKNLNRDIYLFYGNKTSGNIPFKEELTDATNTMPNFKLVNIISDEPGYTGEKGFITLEIIKKYLPKELSSYVYYICGPLPLMQKTVASLLQAGVDKKRIFTEDFSI